MTNFSTRIRTANHSAAFMWLGLAFTLAVLMFRPGGAEGADPTSGLIYPEWNSQSNAAISFDYSAIPTVKKEYLIKEGNGDKKVKRELTGWSIPDILQANNVQITGVPFVRVQVGAKNSSSADDSQMALIALALDKPDTPPMILQSGKQVNGNPFRTPSVVPPQVNDAGISEDQIGYFDAKKTKLTFIPAKSGAQIMGVKITKKATSKGQYRFTAEVKQNNPGGDLNYKWYAADTAGNTTSKEGRVYITTDAKQGTSTHDVKVVVSSTRTGSYGVQSASYVSKKADDGNKRDPYPEPTAPTTNTVPGVGGGLGGGTNQGGTFGSPPAVTPAPTPSPGVTPTPQPTPPTTQPTPETTTPPVTVDTSGITNVAQNVNGNGAVKTITGVLLSAPSIPAAGGGGGTPISELPEPVATAATALFQPVEDAGDLWPYLLSIMFALCFTGAVREWVSP